MSYISFSMNLEKKNLFLYLRLDGELYSVEFVCVSLLLLILWLLKCLRVFQTYRKGRWMRKFVQRSE